jgi:ATP adenylyltransferase
MVPRWVGDTNFMPVFAETKVISEHILATLARLKEGFERLL